MLASCEGKWVAAADPVLLGGVSGGCPHAQVWVPGGDEGEQLLFTMCWRGFVMGHRVVGHC